MTTNATYKECRSDWSHQDSAVVTTLWLQRDDTLSVKGVACETRILARFCFIVSEKVEILSELVDPINITNQ